METVETAGTVVETVETARTVTETIGTVVQTVETVKTVTCSNCWNFQKESGYCNSFCSATVLTV